MAQRSGACQRSPKSLGVQPRFAISEVRRRYDEVAGRFPASSCIASVRPLRRLYGHRAERVRGVQCAVATLVLMRARNFVPLPQQSGASTRSVPLHNLGYPMHDGLLFLGWRGLRSDVGRREGQGDAPRSRVHEGGGRATPV